MASKQVTDRQKSSEVVQYAISHQGTALQDALVARSVAEGGAAVDVSGLLTQLGSSLSGATTAMVAADQAREHELADDPAARAARDEAAKGLYNEIVSAREALVGVYGSAAVDALGFFGSTSQDPVVLARQGRSVVDRLRSGSLPTPRSVHLTLDVASLASSLDPKVLAVEAALGTVNQEAREAQLTLVAKQRAIAEYDATFRAVATTLEGLFSYAGLPELAARVRPSRRSAGVTEEVAGG